MDINICIDRLGLNSNEYKLNQSNPPHEFTEWNGSDAQPTTAELESAWSSYLAEQSSTKYQRDRSADYPSTGDQMDMIYKDIKNSTTTHIDAVEAVKTKWPKNNTGPVE